MSRKSKQDTGVEPGTVSISAALLGEFVKGPMTATEDHSLTMALKKAVIKRAMQAELSHHLGYRDGNSDKYEKDDGPTLVAVAALINLHSAYSQSDLAHFIEANVFNWFIAAPVAHAKNYALLHARRPVHRLAPLYDVISAAPYPKQWANGVSLAMSVSGERRVAAITGSHWRAVARDVGFPSNALVDRIVELGEQIPAALDRMLEGHVRAKVAREIVSHLLEPVAKHMVRCLKQL